MNMMTTRLLFVVACYYVLDSTLSLPVQTANKPPVHKIVEGDNLLIVCNANLSNETEIFWKKNDTNSDFRQNGTELKLIYINRKSAGDYVCYSLDLTEKNITGVNATVVEVVNVDVLYPAEVTEFFLGPNNVTAGSTFSINCNMVGNPDPVWSIMNNRTNASMFSATAPAGVYLRSWPVGCKDTGFWMCTGHNYLNHGKNTTRGDDVLVLCPPAPKYNANKFLVKSAPGQGISLIMNAEGYPYPSYTWSFKGETLPKSMVNSYESMSLLNIFVVHPEDFGVYTLAMNNSIGTYIANYTLAPYDNVGPYAPSGIYFTDVTADSVTLHWTSGYDFGHQQHFVIMRWEGNTFIQIGDPVYDYSSNHGVGDHFSHTVYNLEPETLYKLGIAADTGYGKPAFSRETVEFTTDYEPYDPDGPKERRLGLIIGCSVGGGLAFIGLLAFIVYMVFYRGMNTSYETLKGKDIK